MTDRAQLVTPAMLVEAFCTTPTEENHGAQHGPRRDDDIEAAVSRGWCGYRGGRADMLITGFDDGYEFQHYLEARGWEAIPEKGDWPYVVYLYWAAPEGQPVAVAQYQETDLTVWEFDNRTAALTFMKNRP